MLLRCLLLAFLLLALPVPAPAEGDPWPAVRRERLQALLPLAMQRAGVDAWLVICRENANDPLAEHVGGENASSPAAFLFLSRPEGGLRSVALSPAG